MHETLTDSSTVQVIFISPGTSVIKASPLLCMCKECKNEFGSSSLYKGYDLIVQHLNKVSSRSNFVNEYTPDCERTGTAVNEFVAIDSVVAVATPDKHTDTVWFIMVSSDEMTMSKPIADGYGNTIAAGQVFFHRTVFGANNKSKSLFCQIKKHFLKESVVSPFVQVIPDTRGFIITNDELCEVLAHVEKTGMSRI